jgi:hypothetical protein
VTFELWQVCGRMGIERRYATEPRCRENRGLKPHGYNRFSLRERSRRPVRDMDAIQLRRHIYLSAI